MDQNHGTLDDRQPFKLQEEDGSQTILERVFETNEHDGWNTLMGILMKYTLEMVVSVFYQPVYLFYPIDVANDMYKGALESVKKGTEMASLVLALPMAALFASLTIPINIVIGEFYLVGVAFETVFYWVESLITGDDINDLVNHNI